VGPEFKRPMTRPAAGRSEPYGGHPRRGQIVEHKRDIKGMSGADLRVPPGEFVDVRGAGPPGMR
jgi:hypothetical protein